MEALVLGALALGTALLNYLKTRKVHKRVDHEFTPNGGSSARDLLEQIATEQIRQGRRLDEHLQDHP